MSSSLTARRGATAALAVFAASVLFLVGMAQGSANAATVTKGSAVIEINSPKSAKASAIAPAKGKKVGRKGVRATAPVKSLSIIGSTAKVGLGGGIKLSSGKRSVKITGFSLAISKNLTVVRGKLGGKSIVVFTANGKAKVNPTANTVKLNGAKLKLPASVAKKVKKKLKLKKAPTAKIGTLSVKASKTGTTPVDPCVANPKSKGCNPVDPCVAHPDADGCPPVTVTDPYLAECNVAATSKVTGSLPAAAALPTLADPETTTGPSSIDWGVKSSFRSYIIYGAQGSLHALDGAATTGSLPVFSGFEFPVSDGRYSDNGTTDDLRDDKAVINTRGTALFCATAHKFRVAISDPTIVIDGDNSRIIATVDTNLTGVWTEPQRIDLATLDLSKVTQDPGAVSGSKIDWGALAASFTQTGADAICGTGEQAACNYAAGTELDSIDVAVDVASSLPADQYDSQCGLTPTSAQSGAWPAATGLPHMTGAVATTGPSTIGWGFRQAFRSYVYNAMQFGGGNAALAIQAISPATRNPDNLPDANTAGFQFPVSAGEYAANDEADTGDDQAVVNGTGTALFCNTVHGFWVSISNPSIVIDGQNSRIVADISSNETGVWKQKTRVDLADLDLSGVTPSYNKSGTEVTWNDIPATLSAGVAPFATYSAGTALDPISVAVKTASTAAFPVAGYCSITQTSTISAWPTAIAPPTPFSDANPASAVSAGSLDWGIRSGMRGSNMGNPIVVTTSNDVTASDPADMTGAGKFFTWSADSGSYYSDGKLVQPLHGSVGLCSQAHGYGTVVSDPKVVIDGANSRIVADTAVRVGVDWLRGTVDLVKFDASSITPSETQVAAGTEYTWVVPDSGVTLTAAGASILGPLSGSYVEGAAFQGFTVKATVPAE